MNKKTYDVDTIQDDYILEFGMNDDVLEAWIYHKDFGVKMFICGKMKASPDNILDGIDMENVIDTYNLEYM